tara:strand:+ start:1865 stop:3442 length:1578 start_codon:yes stop_codon:yes gene_type:complete
MKCSISCSFGDVVDKVTILKIKLQKIKNEEALKNIKFELDTIQTEIPLVKEENILFITLQKINEKLWGLEDLIREKSKNKLFDNDYIQTAEAIHNTNDHRCNLKRKINMRYNSEIIEEKSYKQTPLIISDIDKQKLDLGKYSYTTGEYEKSYKILFELMSTYKNYNNYNNFFVDLLFSYSNIITIFNYNNDYYDKLEYIMTNLDSLDIMPELMSFCKKQYSSYCLSNKNYMNNYLNEINCITGPNVNRYNMSFFKDNDKNKTLLIYDGGGIGDKFMFARFIPILCDKYKDNYITFFINGHTKWFFDDCFKNITNYNTVSYSQSHLIGNFDYHCNLLSLLKNLNIDYNNITFTPLFKNIKSKENHKDIIDNIKNNSNKTYIFNWKGNMMNGHEKNNRRMELINAIPLFDLKHINWIVITKDIDQEERDILNNYNIKYYGDILDNGDNCFEDSVSILKNVDGLISTDTSLLHLASNLDIKTIGLLTLGCEWRWTSDKTTNWYPNMILFRQNIFNDWNNVIESLINNI